MAVLASQQTLQPAGIMGNGAYLRKNGTTNHQQYNGPSRSEYDRSSTNTTLLSLGNAQRSSQPSHLTNGNTPTHIASSVDPELSREKPSEGQPSSGIKTESCASKFKEKSSKGKDGAQSPQRSRGRERESNGAKLGASTWMGGSIQFRGIFAGIELGMRPSEHGLISRCA